MKKKKVIGIIKEVIFIVIKKLNLKNDVVFKTFFSRKGNEKYLIDFLNALLKIEITEIKIQEEVNLERLSEIEKGGRLDIQAQLNDGVIVNIEMQVRNEHNIEKRSDIYASKTISRHFERGRSYRESKPVIMVNILDFNIFGFEEYVSKTVTVLDKHRDYKVNSILETYYIELPKFRKSKVDMNDKLNQWLTFIDNENEGDIKMAKEKNNLLKKAGIEIAYLTGEEEVRRLAELRDKWESDWNSSMEYAEEEGIKKGKMEGEKQNKIKIAKAMLNKNMPIELISEITELSIEEIKEID